ncbi:hypothetical protein [Bacillus rubiinfantis]|uniref:hypothetical protein n=1 Tax=Bacillus rubiinfantis TaxID=1499680 RepID=UPI000694B236|nr:hypothetical protein [Bacillus rubiinfantis]
MKQKLIITLSGLFIIFMVGLFIFFFSKDDSSRWQVALGGVLTSALPLLLLKLKQNPFNIPLIICYYLFLFCTLFLGSISSFYLHFHWWDSTLHFFKGIFIGFAAIALFKRLIPEAVRSQVSKWVLSLFSISLAVLASLLWEIYEFVGDLTLTHTMQRGGNTDTMIDLLVGFSGGLLVSIYILFKKRSV